MSMTSIGDIASGLMLRARSAALKQTVSRLTEELASGKVSDVNARLGGDYAYLSDIESGLKRLDGYSVASGEAGVLAATMQTALGRTSDIAGALAETLLGVATSAPGPTSDLTTLPAESGLADIMSALNQSVAGRSAFSGTATDQPALASADLLLSGLKAALAGQNGVSDIRAAADLWFSDPAGFQAIVYTGADQDLEPLRISESEVVDLSIRADNAEFRDVLKEVALAALARDPALGLDAQAQSDLLLDTGQRLLDAKNQIIGVQANLGFAEARIEASVARASATRSSLEIARGELLAADPYDTATRLSEVQFQLESLYSVTVRSAGLSLVNFLR